MRVYQCHELADRARTPRPDYLLQERLAGAIINAMYSPARPWP